MSTFKSVSRMTMLGVLALIALSACAQTDDNGRTTRERLSNTFQPEFDLSGFERPEDQVVADPFEGVNRSIYAFNVQLDRFLLEPAANAYQWALPRPARNSVRSFIDNLKTPVWLANDLLQGEWKRAGETTTRFALNSTFGVLGFYDFAANVADIPLHDEDFGQTLGAWGVGNGPYLMLPVLGPSTARDSVGMIVDIAFAPLSYVETPAATEIALSLRAMDTVDLRYRTAPVIDAAREAADPYAQIRSLYIQRRLGSVNNGEEDFEDLPDFE